MSAWSLYRFHADEEDFRSVRFPPPGPYWCSGYGDGYSIVVAVLPTGTNVQEWWPEASHIEVQESGPPETTFTERFPRPKWWAAAP